MAKRTFTKKTVIPFKKAGTRSLPASKVRTSKTTVSGAKPMPKKGPKAKPMPSKGKTRTIGKPLGRKSY